MKKSLFAAAFLLCAAPLTALAGAEGYTNPPVAMESDNDSTPALILLGLLGVVVASTALGGFASRNDNEMLPEEPVDE